MVTRTYTLTLTVTVEAEDDTEADADAAEFYENVYENMSGALDVEYILEKNAYVVEPVLS